MATATRAAREVSTRYEPVIGLEVHAQLLTATKIFCSCRNRFGDEPNTNVCPVCLGLPGALPVLSREAVTLAMRGALATHCTVQETSIFARKNYFYPDLPKGYQISQYERPLATEGYVEIPSGGAFRRVRVQRIHMEEDAGKLLHEGFPWSGEKSGVDFNRSGIPLIVIVSPPDLRSTEEAHDYRYFPEPDLPPLVVGREWVEEVRRSLPELPAEKRRRFVAEYGIPDYDAGVLTLSREVADYYETVARESGSPKAASNWVMTEVLRKLKDDERPLAACPVKPGQLAELVELVEAGTITGKSAKEVFEKMWASAMGPRAIVEREGLTQVSDEGPILAAIAEVMAASPEQVATYRKGKTNTLGWFVGQVMKKTGGRANPQVVNALLKKALDGPG